MKTALLLCVLVISACTKQTDPYEVLLSGNDAEVRGWIHPWDRIGELPMLRDSKGREYGIENLPKELEGRSVQIKGVAKYIRRVSSPNSLNQMIIRLSDIRPGRREIEKWDDVVTAEYSDPSKFLAALNAFQGEIGMPLPFWPPDDTEPSGEILGSHLSGCGPLYTMFVKTIPKVRQKYSPGSDDVFELNEKGEIIRRWSIPGNSVVDGIQSDRLLLAADTNTLFRSMSSNGGRGLNLSLAIAPDGSFHIVEIKGPLQDFVMMDCPFVKEFEGSAYARCGVFEDLESEQPRRLAYQGPCT